MTQQTTTISFFRFEGFQSRSWAFAQMQFSRGALMRTPSATFCKMFGSGSGESFDPKPNLGVYAIMLVWPSETIARRGLAASRVLAKYRSKAAESATVYLGALQCRGQWDGMQPFVADSGPRSLPEPIGIITRATIRKRNALKFWRHVPNVSAEIASHPSVLFKLGMGEVPWFQQVTFSIWTSAKDMYEFAYQNGAHARAVEKVRDEVWFKEDLFARFQIFDWEGTWDGQRPVEGAGAAAPADVTIAL